MPEFLTGFVPFGEWLPDQRLLANPGLSRAEGVIPVYGNYITSPTLNTMVGTIAGSAGAIARGMHIHQVNGKAYAALRLAGPVVRLYELDDAGSSNDRSKAGAYDESGVWTGCSFGNNVVMTAAISPVQYQAGAAGAFADLITSTFKPQAHHVFSLRDNLFLANCYLLATYDGLPQFENPTLVAWSQSGNMRAFGSARVDPQLVGAGFQPLNFDIGDIRAVAAGSDFAILGFSNGFVRLDGPPYTFRIIAKSFGTLWRYGMCAAGDDIYVFTAAGLARLRNGEGPLEVLGAGKFVRSLIDNATGFGAAPAGLDSSLDYLACSMAHDPLNDLLWIAYTEANPINIEDILFQPTYSKALLCYNIREDRLTFFRFFHEGEPVQVRYLRAGRTTTDPWRPGRDIRFLWTIGDNQAGPYSYGRGTLGNSFMQPVLAKGYMQLQAGKICRFRRLRPIYSVTDQDAIEKITVHIDATTKPYLTPTTFGPFSTVDLNGWITMPGPGGAGEFLAPRFTITPNSAMHQMVEFEGFEYEAEIVGSSLA